MQDKKTKNRKYKELGEGKLEEINPKNSRKAGSKKMRVERL